MGNMVKYFVLFRFEGSEKRDKKAPCWSKCERFVMLFESGEGPFIGKLVA